MTKSPILEPIKCKHTEGPEGYLQHMDWLHWMLQRYDQLKCPKCGLWKIYKRISPSPLVSDKLKIKKKK